MLLYPLLLPFKHTVVVPYNYILFSKNRNRYSVLFTWIVSAFIFGKSVSFNDCRNYFNRPLWYRLLHHYKQLYRLLLVDDNQYRCNMPSLLLNFLHPFFLSLLIFHQIAKGQRIFFSRGTTLEKYKFRVFSSLRLPRNSVITPKKKFLYAYKYRCIETKPHHHRYHFPTVMPSSKLYRIITTNPLKNL